MTYPFIHNNFLDIEKCFLHCKTGFKKCLEAPGNEFLQEELGIPFEDLILKEESIHLEYDSKMFGEAIIDIRINLINKHSQTSFGYYRSIKSFDGRFIDEFLVFYS